MRIGERIYEKKERRKVWTVYGGSVDGDFQREEIYVYHY